MTATIWSDQLNAGVVILVSEMLMACVVMEDRALFCLCFVSFYTNILMNMICGLCEITLCFSACVAGDTQELYMQL